MTDAVTEGFDNEQRPSGSGDRRRRATRVFLIMLSLLLLLFLCGALWVLMSVVKSPSTSHCCRTSQA
jgi:hypothetical protein